MNSSPSDRPRRTLRQRLLTFLILPLATLLIVSLAADYHIAFEPAAEAYDLALLDDAFALAGRIHVAGGAIEVDLSAGAEAVLRSDGSDQEFLAVYGPDGRLLKGDADLLPGATPTGTKPAISNAVLRGQEVRKADYRIDTDLGPVTVLIAETMKKREHAGSKIFAAILFSNVFVIVATLALVYVGVRSGLAPLTHLSEEISRRTPHDLTPLPLGDVPGEAEPLVRAMGGLIDDLRAAATAQQAFLANAAHQLKTPLAGLQTQLELAAEEIPGEYRKRMVHLRDATQRLGHLTHQLLALARSGPEAAGVLEMRPVDLGKLLTDCASMWFDLALTKDIDLGFESAETTVIGSEWLLRELLANLIDNALQYTPVGGKVTVRNGIERADRHIFLEVEDNGPGIAVEEQERIFQRFYRAQGTPGAGTGLGLAIVKEAADRHHATVEILDAPSPGGTRIRVVFPAADPRSDQARKSSGSLGKAL